MSLVAFDLDGTLEDSRVDMVSAVQRVRATLGLPHRPDDDFRPHVNRGMPHLYRVCFEEYIEHEGMEAIPELQRLYTEDYSAHIADNTRLYEGIADTLEALSKQFSLAVVTNKPESLSRQLLSARVDHFFQAIIGGDTCESAKRRHRLLKRHVNAGALYIWSVTLWGTFDAHVHMERHRFVLAGLHR